jgi:hypothetical protein
LKETCVSTVISYFDKYAQFYDPFGEGFRIFWTCNKKSHQFQDGTGGFISYGMWLLYAGAGLDLGFGACVEPNLVGGKSGGADGQSDEGGYCYDDGLFHGDSPFV